MAAALRGIEARVTRGAEPEVQVRMKGALEMTGREDVRAGTRVEQADGSRHSGEGFGGEERTEGHDTGF
jgi:hypothetical protein